MKKIYFFILSSLLIGFFYILFFSLKIDKNYDTQNLIGKNISEIELNLLNENKKFNNIDLKKNDFTAINFFSSWCGPCRQEHKYLMSLSKNKNLKILGINFKDDEKKANEFLNKLGNPYYLIASDKNGKKAINFGVYGIPETILINNDMLIIKKYIGPLNSSEVKEILKIVENK